MLLRYLLLSVFITGLIACSDGPEVNNADLIIRNGAKYLKTSTEPFTGVGIVEHGFEGNRMKITYKNGLQHGSSYIYFPDGTIQFESVFDKGVKTFSTAWYPSGVRRSRTKYTGRNSSLEEVWYPNGKRLSIAAYQFGQLVPGSQTMWYKDGNEIK